MGGLFTFDLDDGLASGCCPICYALALDERRWMESFWREGRQGKAARERFYAGGGFCTRHAWLLHELALAGSSGVAVADVYGGLAGRDIAALERRHELPARKARCSACVARDEALTRKAEFLLELMATESGRARYTRSRGLCFGHLGAMLDLAGEGELADFVLDDWRRRVDDVRERLAADEVTARTDVIRLYAGDLASCERRERLSRMPPSG
jgi:hypothetical protein